MQRFWFFFVINPRYEGEKNFSFIEEYKIHGEQTMNRKARQQEDAFVSWWDQKNEQKKRNSWLCIHRKNCNRLFSYILLDLRFYTHLYLVYYYNFLDFSLDWQSPREKQYLKCALSTYNWYHCNLINVWSATKYWYRISWLKYELVRYRLQTGNRSNYER